MFVIGSRYLRLFIISILFMFVFQLEARLISYVYLFHEGLLLVQSVLLGGGTFLLGYHLLSEKIKLLIGKSVPMLIVVSFLIQQWFFFSYNIFLLDVITLSILFGWIFLEISFCITMSSNRFYALELLGSFVGVLLYVIGVLFFLEEVLLPVAATSLLVYATLFNGGGVKYKIITGSIVIAGVAFFVFAMSTSSIPALLSCSTQNASYGFKSPCLDDATGRLPEMSFTHLKGRLDVYFNENAYGVKYLNIKSNGYYVSAGNLESNSNEPWFDLLEHRIAKLDYKDESKVLSIGGGVGSYVQALQSYIINPDITVVEIDSSMQNLYEVEEFKKYLPPLDNHTLLYGEGRSFVTKSEDTFDVITVTVETINSTMPKYVDERTGLLFTDTALKTYIDHLNPGGYLLFEQYYPKQEGGDAMAVKFLSTLQSAAGVNIETFSKNIVLYTRAFGTNSESQRFLTGAYKPDGFSSVDVEILSGWIERIQSFEGQYTLNPYDVSLLHVPSLNQQTITYQQYFNTYEKETLSQEFNTEIITDDKPFRHFITKLPFPTFSYSVFLIFAAVATGVIGLLTRTLKIKNNKLVITSMFFGVLTFGLQYLLFYKTAAFLNTNLIFFSVFLLVPLFFSAIGGYISTLVNRSYHVLIAILFASLSIVIATLDMFESSQVFIFALIALLFGISGFLFPLLLEKSEDKTERAIIYASNIMAGGFAMIIMITLHATIGWTITFYIIGVLITLSVWLVYKLP